MNFLLFVLTLTAHAATSTTNVDSCRAVKKEKCFEFRGRAAEYMGRAGTRIWQVGTKQFFEVQSQTPTAYTELDKLTFHNKFYANFKGCPVEERKAGAMQGICIESLKNIRFETIPE